MRFGQDPRNCAAKLSKSAVNFQETAVEFQKTAAKSVQSAIPHKKNPEISCTSHTTIGKHLTTLSCHLAQTLPDSHNSLPNVPVSALEIFGVSSRKRPRFPRSLPAHKPQFPALSWPTSPAKPRTKLQETATTLDFFKRKRAKNLADSKILSKLHPGFTLHQKQQEYKTPYQP